ncbi:helix-turn-helix transcriptional regulator [Haloarchaeobius salinus]|uniref:helix-turn-helix transcriptional regulator n=1 Tax=Haloarchaeobius salinus TaxID=1198298 RepID=UPI002108F78B|nr:MarR family transcriptional regulator [Haloarchaeobius salinus]
MEDIAYLGRSENRLPLLNAVAEKPATRSELSERTGIASTTIGRLINEFQGRNWVERTTDGEYRATPTGRSVVRVFTPFVASMETIRSLGDAVGWLPMDELSIELQHFSEARILRSSPNAPYEFVEQLSDRIRAASWFRVLTFLDPPLPSGEAMQTGVVEGRLTAEHVLAGGLVEYLREQKKQPPRWMEYIEAGATVYCYDGHIPCNLFITDKTVLIMDEKPEGGGAAIESHDETVRRAVTELYENYRDAAVLVKADRFA